MVDLVLSCILVPASTVLAVVCAGGPYTEDMSEPAKSSFSQYVVHGLLSSFGYDLHISYPVFPRDAHAVYSSAICDVQHPDFLPRDAL